MRGKTVFKVRSYECGADSRATLPTICNYLQEAASVNAEYLGFSKSDFDSAGENISWVLTRLVVKMDRYPMWLTRILSAMKVRRTSFSKYGTIYTMNHQVEKPVYSRAYENTTMMKEESVCSLQY